MKHNRQDETHAWLQEHWDGHNSLNNTPSVVFFLHRFSFSLGFFATHEHGTNTSLLISWRSICLFVLVGNLGSPTTLFMAGARSTSASSPASVFSKPPSSLSNNSSTSRYSDAYPCQEV
mmetsp:Transcript_20636/g.59160  ORF Transcript_20636/g.59160 Transcript_20636/m.59160 type:complete len:119 (-) Transcript_20636:609-965(-)